MPSSASTVGRIELQALGEKSNTWGQPGLNNCMTALDEEAGGVTEVTVSGSDVTLDSTNYTPSIATHYRYSLHRLIAGASVGARNIIIPSVAKSYRFHNATAYTQTVKTSGDAGVAVRAGQLAMVYCDGSSTYIQDPTLDKIKTPAADVALGGFKITGLGTPSASTDGATKGYVDALNIATGASATTTAQARAGASGNSYLSPAVFYGAHADVALTDAASISVDLSAGRVFSVTLGANSRAFAAPSGAVDGMEGYFLVNPSTFSSPTWDASYVFANGAPALVASAVNVIHYYVDSTAPVLRCTFLGSTGYFLGANAKTTTYTAVAADLGKEITATNSWTLTLTAPATLGSGWFTHFRNIGTGVITISPASGTIDGLSSIIAYPNESFTIKSDGTNFTTTGRQRGWIPMGSTAITAAANIDITWSDAELSAVRLIVTGLRMTGQVISGRVRKSGSFITGATYSQNYSANGAADTNSATDTEFALSGAVAGSSGQGWGGEVLLGGILETTAGLQFVDWHGRFVNAGTRTRVVGAGYETGTGAAMTGFRFFPASGSFTAGGTIQCMGYRA